MSRKEGTGKRASLFFFRAETAAAKAPTGQLHRTETASATRDADGKTAGRKTKARRESRRKRKTKQDEKSRKTGNKTRDKNKTPNRPKASTSARRKEKRNKTFKTACQVKRTGTSVQALFLSCSRDVEPCSAWSRGARRVCRAVPCGDSVAERGGGPRSEEQPS